MKFMKNIFVAIFMVALCLALTSAGCETISGGGSSSNGGGASSGDADSLTNEVNSKGDPSINVTGIKFTSGRYTLRPNKTYDISKWVDTERVGGGVLPADLKIEVSVPPTPSTYWQYFSISGMTLTTTNTAVDPANPPYTIKATSSKGNAETVIEISNPNPSLDISNVTPAQAKKKVYVTDDRIDGPQSTSPWYAIYFIDESHVRVGMCSVARVNAIKLASGEKPGTGSSHILEYTYDSGIYTLNGFVRCVGGDCVIKDGVLTNYFFAGAPTVFKLN